MSVYCEKALLSEVGQPITRFCFSSRMMRCLSPSLSPTSTSGAAAAPARLLWRSAAESGRTLTFSGELSSPPLSGRAAAPLLTDRMTCVGRQCLHPAHDPFHMSTQDQGVTIQTGMVQATLHAQYESVLGQGLAMAPGPVCPTAGVSCML